MIRAHKKKGHGAHFVTPISKTSFHLAGGLFVDDTDLFHLDMRKVETAAEAQACLQEAVISWGNLLNPPRGCTEASEMLLLFDLLPMESRWYMVVRTKRTQGRFCSGCPNGRWLSGGNQTPSSDQGH